MSKASEHSVLATFPSAWLFRKWRRMVLYSYLLAIAVISFFLILIVLAGLLVPISFIHQTELIFYGNPIEKPSMGGGVARPKLILYWTKFFDAVDFHVGFGEKPFSGCPVKSCVSTNNRSLLHLSDAVVFHIGDIRSFDMPTFRLPHQRWIFFYLEPPHHTVPLHDYANVFNWTMTYRADSDIYHPYGRTWPITRRIPSQVSAVKVTELISDLNEFRRLKNSPRDDVTDLRFDYDTFIKNKTKGIAWFVSNCITTSARENYVHKLRQFIDVDIYGKCGNLSCVGRTSCSEMVGRDYKFYLAFENSVCVDYVTEKFFNMLHHGVVPIVFGLEAHSKISPPKSFIDADSFESPEALANYLHVLSNSDTLYKEYLQWNDKFKPKVVGGWCTFCQMLNDPDQGASIYRDIHQWWFNKGHCELRS